MSEASRVWRVEVDGIEHEIEVDHSAMTNKIVVKLDGAVVDETRLWFTNKDVQFDVGARRAEAASAAQANATNGSGSSPVSFSRTPILYSSIPTPRRRPCSATGRANFRNRAAPSSRRTSGVSSG